MLNELYASLAFVSIVIPSRGKCLEHEKHLKKNANGIMPHKHICVLIVW